MRPAAGSRPDRSILGGLAVLLAAGVLGALGGPLGAAAGLALVACWYLLGPIYAVAVGQIAVVALARDWPLLYVAGAELAVLAVLVVPDVTSVRGRRLAASTVVGGGLLGLAAAGAQLTWETTWATAVVLVGVAAFASYGLHRYELVAIDEVQ